jgi:hypothetical protein
MNILDSIRVSHGAAAGRIHAGDVGLVSRAVLPRGAAVPLVEVRLGRGGPRRRAGQSGRASRHGRGLGRGRGGFLHAGSGVVARRAGAGGRGGDGGGGEGGEGGGRQGRRAGLEGARGGRQRVGPVGGECLGGC